MVITKEMLLIELRKYLTTLTPEQRVKLFDEFEDGYCRHCGDALAENQACLYCLHHGD